jgi:hypothetical protein
LNERQVRQRAATQLVAFLDSELRQPVEREVLVANSIQVLQPFDLHRGPFIVASFSWSCRLMYLIATSFSGIGLTAQRIDRCATIPRM